MNVRIFLVCMGLCANASAATLSGSIDYSFKGMHSAVPFSVSEGEEVVIKDVLKVTPYVKSITKTARKVNGKPLAMFKERGEFLDGGFFKLRVKPLDKNNVMTAYSIQIDHLDKMTNLDGLDLPDASSVINNGILQVKRGERTQLFNSEGEKGKATVSIVFD